MDKSVLDTPPPQENRPAPSQPESLVGQPLDALLKKLMERFGLSVSQVAVSAGMDESALHKILKSDHREFKAEHVDKLLEDLETLGKLIDLVEKVEWRKSLHIAAYLHFDYYKTIQPRLAKIEDPAEREKVLADHLSRQNAALAKTYESSGGQFPIVLPLGTFVARHMIKQWDWIKVPPAYELLDVEGDSYIILHDLTQKVPDEGVVLPEGYKIEYVGFRKFRVRRPKSIVVEPLPQQPKPNQPDRRIVRVIKPELMRIPAGKFVMGSRDGNKLASDNERPQHTVEIPYTYRIARCPVTNAEFAAFVEAAKFKSDAVTADLPDHPVVNVSWGDAQAYCKWLTGQLRADGTLTAKEIVRLPTEAEWEKAARGEYGKEWPWGDEWDAAKCNNVKSEIGTTTPVGQYSALGGDSPYGVADMVGNVWEWCQSKYKPYPYKVDDGREDLKGEDVRVLRGGAFFILRDGARCAFRSYLLPDYRFNYLGFRVVVASPGFLNR